MENALLYMKVIAVAHGIIGYLGGAATASPEIQANIIYQDRNPLVGDVKKYLVYGMCFCLVLCGLCPWFKPSATPLWAWLALGFHLVSSALDFATQRGRLYCWRCMATGITVKIIAAAALTYLATILPSVRSD
nr:orf133EGC123 [uncultured bacterium]